MKGPGYFALVSDSAARKKNCRCGLLATPTQKCWTEKNIKTKQCRQREEQKDLQLPRSFLYTQVPCMIFLWFSLAKETAPAGVPLWLGVEHNRYHEQRTRWSHPHWSLFMWASQPPPPPKREMKSLKLSTTSVACTDMVFPDVQTCWASMVRPSVERQHLTRQSSLS